MDERDLSPVDGRDVAVDMSPGPNNGSTAPEDPEPESGCYYCSLGEFAT